jgi:hypothetical protein
LDTKTEEFMFGFYYAAAGLVFGILCSKKAKEKGISNTEWFTFGFALNIFAYFLLSMAPEKDNGAKELIFPRN